MMRNLIMLACVAVVVAGTTQAAAPENVTQARQALENARIDQTQIVNKLTALTADRDRNSSVSELLIQLGTIQEMQTSVVRADQALLVQTFGKAMDKLSQVDRQAVEQLSVDQKTVRQRWVDFAATLAKVAQEQGAPQGLSTVQARVEASPIAAIMDKAATQASENRLAEASANGKKAADELARLMQVLEAATSSARELSEKRVRELQEIIRLEIGIRKRLASDVDWRRIRREQGMVRERTSVLTFEEAQLPAQALEGIREAYDQMEAAEKAMRSEDEPASVERVDKALEALTRSVEILIAAASASEEDGMPEVPQVKQKKKKNKFGGMPAMMGAGGSEGIDISPIAQIAADIAAVAKIRRQQKMLYEETIGKTPAKPLAANRQRAYASPIPQLARRIELYLAPAAGLLDEARESMAESMEHLQASDNPASATSQEVALDRLRVAEDQMRQFWKELFEAMAAISSVDGSAPPHGAAQKLEEKAKMKLLLQLMREIVRVGELIKQQEVIIAKTKGWLDVPKDTVDADVVILAAEHQFTLSRTALDIFEKLKPVGEEAQSLPEAVVEAAQWMEGASNAMKEMNFAKTRQRQDVAMEFLENAWSILAMSMSTLSQQEQEQQESPSDNKPSDSQQRDSQMAGIGADVVNKDGEPWYLNLPPQARDAIQQSMDEALPPKFAPAIQRYYERLSRSNNDAK